jgi:integrase
MGGIYRRGSIYWIRYRAGGPPIRESSGSPRRADAVALLAERLGEIATGRVRGPQQARVTVTAVLDDYEDALVLRGAKSCASVRWHLKTIRAAFGSRWVRDLSTAELRAWAKHQIHQEQKKSGTVKVRLALLQSALRHAHREGRIATVPVFPQVPRSTPKQGFFEPSEHQAIVAHLPDPLNHIAEFAYHVGWRREEILGLRWEYVDRHARIIRLPDSKTGHGTALPLLGGLWTLIEQRWSKRVVGPRHGAERLSEWVFHRRGRRVKNFSLAWRQACEKAGVVGRTLHDYRRTVARDLIDAGNDYKSAMAVTHHDSMTTFQHYQIRDLRSTSRALDRLQQYRKAGQLGHNEHNEHNFGS